MSFKNLIRPSGGLYYHAKAWLNRKRWREFSCELEQWLNSWPCDYTKPLILIGPSAGYTLSTLWLKKFPHILAFDLDPLAGLLFRKIHPQIHIQFLNQDVFWKNAKLSLDSLGLILDENKGANFLFCNVIGQVLLEGQASENEWIHFLKQLRHLMQGHCWASYHDLISTRNGLKIDHLTSGEWTLGLKKCEWNWQLSKAAAHQIQGVWESPEGERLRFRN